MNFKTSTRLDSSGFEHVFVGETKSGTEIVGFHNWIQFYLQEKNHHLDYKGYKARNQDLVSATVNQKGNLFSFKSTHISIRLLPI